MPRVIRSAQINILDLFVANIDFAPGLNIISGENGTMKTRLLQQMKNERGRLTLSDGVDPVRMQAISPKRNAERRAFSTIFQTFRQNNTKLDSLINERGINDHTFDNYPSVGDLFYVVYEDQCRDGGNQREKMQEATEQFNNVIQEIFSSYRLHSEWDEPSGSPNIKLVKNGESQVPLEALSLGEQEMLALVINIYTSKDRYDIFLIDEPEVHLNWHLEDKLFNYLDNFCENYQKQIIAVTHSRAIFKKRFFDKSQFLYWGDDKKVHCSQQLTPAQQLKLAGDAIDIIRMGDFKKPTFFVEDGRHEDILLTFARNYGVDVSVTACGNSSNVKALFKQAKREGGWQNSYFVIDGDNQGNPFPGEGKFIHLNKYCLENYLLDIPTVMAVSGRTEDEVRQSILSSIKANRAKILKKNQFFDFLFDGLTDQHITPDRLAKLDASEILDSLLQLLGFNFGDFLEIYMQKCFELGRHANAFPSPIVAILESAVASAAVEIEHEQL